jgi:hypothetical protein
VNLSTADNKKAECIFQNTFRLSEFKRRNYTPAVAAAGVSFFAAYFFLNFSMRPAESSNFCLPV